MFKIIASALFIFLGFNSLAAQIVFENHDSNIYQFLDKLAIKQVIQLNDQVKPLPRKLIAEKLLTAKEDQKNLTKLEKEELQFYLREYGLELRLIDDEITGIDRAIFSEDNSGRYRFFSYSSEYFTLAANPVFGVTIGKNKEREKNYFPLGLNAFGYLGNYFGYSFNVLNNRVEPGDQYDSRHRFTWQTGVNIDLADADRIEYREVRTVVTGSWEWGSMSLGKDFMSWGQAESGTMVLSDKAPSFPFIRLDIHPVKWFSFNYIHGWLNSNVVDSNYIYSTFRDNTKRFKYRQKFLAQHSVTFQPFNGFYFSFGESIIYSDRMEMVYLIPIMFFDLGDEYISRHSNLAGDNTQFFFGINSEGNIKNTKLFGTFFADELTTNDITDPEKQYYKFGFTLGSKVVDLPVDNLTLAAEYTKIYPGVYQHFIPTQTFKSSDYVLGHWMGDNADQIYVAAGYSFLRGLDFELTYRYLRKGAEATGNTAYEKPIPEFLSGLDKYYTYYGVNVEYEVIHDLKIVADLLLVKRESELRSGDFTITNLDEMYIGFLYGL